MTETKKETNLYKSITISLPPELLKEIDGIAEAETRTRSSQMQHMLKQSVKAYKMQQAGLSSN